MNVTELARKLKIPTKDLLERLPEMGYSIGKRAIKINDDMAYEIIRKWPVLNKMYEARIEKERLEKSSSRVVKEGKSVKTVAVPPYITVREFSERSEVPVPKVIQTLMSSGIFASLNERIDFDTAQIIGDELGLNIVEDQAAHADDVVGKEEQITQILGQESEKSLKSRPPVVVVMGHVDHGKTKLLDAIRTTNVVAGEAGGITQHIGAYQVEKKGMKLTFIDTPGHEAFTAMRSRGARIADIAILVVAADDSVKPQTIEALRIIQQTELPIIVAINKIDKPDANIDKVKADLAQHGLTPEEWGGNTVIAQVSALKNLGIDDLLEMVVLVAEEHANEIKANPNGQVVGTIIESHVDKGEGPVATLLVQNGTLNVGGFLGVEGTLYGKARAMKDWNGMDLKQATPSTPVKILGFKVAPKVGDIVVVAESQGDLKKKIAYQDLVKDRVAAQMKTRIKDEDEESQIKKLNLIVKADMLGSLEAITESLEKIHHPEVQVRIASKGLGNITEGDVLQADSIKAQILAFHVKPSTNAVQIARDKQVTVKEYKVIYDLLNDVNDQLNSMLGEEIIRTDIGELSVLALFKRQGKKQVIGVNVKSGRVMVDGKVRIYRQDIEIGEGYIDRVQVGKEQVRDVEFGNECGLELTSDVDIEKDDRLIVFKEDVREKKLSDAQ